MSTCLRLIVRSRFWFSPPTLYFSLSSLMFLFHLHDSASISARNHLPWNNNDVKALKNLVALAPGPGPDLYKIRNLYFIQYMFWWGEAWGEGNCRDIDYNTWSFHSRISEAIYHWITCLHYSKLTSLISAHQRKLQLQLHAWIIQNFK